MAELSFDLLRAMRADRKRPVKAVLRMRSSVHDDGGNWPSIVRFSWQQHKAQSIARRVARGR
jgi:hypothetical protein